VPTAVSIEVQRRAHENGTIVHVEILPGTAAEYVEAVARGGVIRAWRMAPA
jgi:hypothetical protein